MPHGEEGGRGREADDDAVDVLADDFDQRFDIDVDSYSPAPELLKLLVSKLGGSDPCWLLHHDVALDRLLTLVGAGWGVLLTLEGATGAAYQGVTFREVHDAEGPTRLSFRAYWRQDNCNPSLRPFLALLRERYPDLSADPETT